MSAENRNEYLDQAVAQQERLEQDLRLEAFGAGAGGRRPRPRVPPAARAAPAAVAAPVVGPTPAPSAVDVRVTGFWRWKTVLVPPNAFVVHTRRGHAEPLHVGLGTSFRFDPARDSYLVVPGAMQTILINAFCICRELQGLVVQAYVQWIIQDFATAYRKLDFSDADDPMRLVNLQLKEQAEAAIKDKVATMSVHEVLSDKQPIVEELTARLRAMAEGEGGSRPRARAADRHRADQGGDRQLGPAVGEPAEAVPGRAGAHRPAGRARRRGGDHRAGAGGVPGAGDAAAGDRAGARRAARPQRRGDVRPGGGRAGPPGRARAGVGPPPGRAAERDDCCTSCAWSGSAASEELEVGRLRLEREYALQRLSLDGELALAQARTDADHASALLELERDRIRAAIDNEASPESDPGEADRLAAGDRGEAAEARRAARRDDRGRLDHRGRPDRRARRGRRRPSLCCAVRGGHNVGGVRPGPTSYRPRPRHRYTLHACRTF